MRGLIIIASAALLSIKAVTAAPTLQMHVFDDEQLIIHSTEQQLSQTNIEQSPARKHRLQTHVFEPSDNLLEQYHAMPADTANNLENKTPILQYQRAELYASTGYRKDELNWSISGLNGTPNILSELEWEDIEIATVNVGTTLYFQPNWLLNVDFTYGHIFDGDNQDSDYLGNNRTLEFSRSNNSADKGSVIDGSIHAGYQWLAMSNQQKKIYLIPKIGFSYHAQFFNITDGFQTIPALGAFSGLDSNYDATWYGPWLGLESEFVIGKSLSLGLNFEYHYAFYDATANWNLRSDFAHPESFTHEAEGYGLVGNVNARYRLNNDLSLNFSINYQDWQANRNGVDKTFFSDGSSLKTGFNGVNWNSFGANIGLAYQF
ncbi:MAG: TonB-dependent receptor [Methylophaga sp.]|nr:TonB-dependent receptor [Methylophaga sp.]